MVKLEPQSACAGLLPLTIGALTLREEDAGPMSTIAPFKAKGKALSDALKKAHGMVSPAPNRTSGRAGARVLWFGQNMLLLMGTPADAALGEHAALSDQTDAWAVVRLEGAGARDVLGRLTPLDLRDSMFKHGHTARSDLRHMMASITRLGDDSWQIMVFRGFAQTLVHDMQTAMRAVAARSLSDGAANQKA